VSSLDSCVDTATKEREKECVLANVLYSFFAERQRKDGKDGGYVWGEERGIMFELTGIMFELTELIMAQATTQPIVTGSSIIGIKYTGGVMVPNFLQTSFRLPHL
jgi:hypothetical protein